jgi:predicted RNA-binding Zn ribbon-like protein
LARRVFQPIKTVPLVGGALCLDFVNTTGARGSGRPRERLTNYGDWLVFCRRIGLVSGARAAELQREAAGRPGEARRALEHVIAVREVLFRLLDGLAAGAAVRADDLALFNRELAEAGTRRRLVWRGGLPRWTWSETPPDLDRMLAPLVFSVAELLSSAERTRIRRCGECDWLFVDTTRNGSRRWCKAACGDRVKARRYYRRHRRGRASAAGKGNKGGS